VLQFPLARIVLGIVFVAVGVLVAQVVIAVIERALGLKSPLPALFVVFEVLFVVLLTYSAYGLYVRLIERRPLVELSWHGSLSDEGHGLVGGFVLIAVVVGILWLLGDYHVTGTHAWTVILAPLAADVPSAVIQQVLVQGIIFRITEQVLGTWWALLITVVLFGLVHLLLLPHVTVASLLAIVLGGLLFTAAYVRTRRLWLSSSVHAALDFTQDALFGVGAYGLAGVAANGLLLAHTTGPVALTGGASGVEASALTLVMLLAAATALLVLARQHGQMTPPSWRRDNLSTQSSTAARPADV
jgi:membrane protease YdiL (CAAX protease family)